MSLWPDHCIVDDEWPNKPRTENLHHDVYKILQTALDAWEADTGKKVQYICKGTDSMVRIQ